MFKFWATLYWCMQGFKEHSLTHVKVLSYLLFTHAIIAVNASVNTTYKKQAHLSSTFVNYKNYFTIHHGEVFESSPPNWKRRSMIDKSSSTCGELLNFLIHSHKRWQNLFAGVCASPKVLAIWCKKAYSQQWMAKYYWSRNNGLLTGLSFPSRLPTAR